MNTYPSNAEADHRATRARLERISEPWAINKSVAIVGTLILGVIFASWAASGQFENLILAAVWIAAAAIIIFVQDYWWAPPMVITAFGISTQALGFPMGGMEMGVVIIALTLPVKMAMKTLNKAEPVMRHGLAFWVLFGYVFGHFIFIYCYQKFEGTDTMKNIVKAYYNALTPLVFYGLAVRYCRVETIARTMVVLFWAMFVAILGATVVYFKDIGLGPLTELRISISWLTTDGAQFVLRSLTSYLFIGSVAFYPATAPGWHRKLLIVAAALSVLGALVGGGRLNLATIIMAALFFAVVRRRLFLALPVIFLTVMTSGFITAYPEALFNLPEGAQRSLAPLNFSEHKTQMQEGLVGSDDWHAWLRRDSLVYWLTDTTSFWLGHGYKPWDPTVVSMNDPTVVDQNRLAELAVEMGLCENMFNAITNIFGIVGLLLYAWFLIMLLWKLYQGYRRSPRGSYAHAMCEFSILNIVPAIVLAPFMGSVPGLTLIYWQLGILAARPWLGDAADKPATAGSELPKFIPRELRVGRA